MRSRMPITFLPHAVLPRLVRHPFWFDTPWRRCRCCSPGGVAALNIQRLVYRPSDVSRDAITSHLLFVLHHPAAPPPIRLQAGRTLDDILAIVPRHLLAAPSDLHATVQRRVLDVLAQQIMLGELASGSSMELRRLGLKTLHQILQASGHTLG
jgi:hypothetical protein